MQQPVNSQTTYYNATFRHGVDEKRRVQIPAKWRPGEENTELTLILWPANPAGLCVRVLPPGKMAELAKTLDAMPGSDPNKPVLKRFIGGNSAQVTVDRNGRICLPDSMARDAGISEEAVLVGMVDVFEIWSPDRFDKVSAADAVLAQEAFKLIE